MYHRLFIRSSPSEFESFAGPPSSATYTFDAPNYILRSRLFSTMVSLPCSVNSPVKLICPQILPALGNFTVTSVLPSLQRKTQLNSLVQHLTEIDRTFTVLATVLSIRSACRSGTSMRAEKTRSGTITSSTIDKLKGNAQCAPHHCGNS